MSSELNQGALGSQHTSALSRTYFASPAYQQTATRIAARRAFSPAWLLRALAFFASFIPVEATQSSLTFQSPQGILYRLTERITSINLNISEGVASYFTRGACGAEVLPKTDATKEWELVNVFCIPNEKMNHSEPLTSLYIEKGGRIDELFAECIKIYTENVCRRDFNCATRRDLYIFYIVLVLTSIIMFVVINLIFRHHISSQINKSFETVSSKSPTIPTNIMRVQFMNDKLRQLVADLEALSLSSHQFALERTLKEKIHNLDRDISKFVLEHVSPYSRSIMNEPIVLSTGHAIDRQNFIDYLRNSNKPGLCPVSNQPIYENSTHIPRIDLYRNNVINEGLLSFERQVQKLESDVAVLKGEVGSAPKLKVI